jgi:hypothetical protein
MAKIKWDVSSSDPEQATRNFEPPVPGMYVAKVAECKLGYKKVDGVEDKKQPRLEVTYEIVSGVGGKKHAGAHVWDYLSYSEAAAFRMDQFLQAVGVATKKKRKGTLDTEEITGLPVRLRVKGDTFNDAYQAKVGGVFQASDEDLDELDDELGDDAGEDEEEDDEEDEEESEEEEDETDSYGLAALEEMGKAELIEVAKAMGLKPPADVRKKAATLAEWIFDNQPNPPDGEEEEDEEEESEDDYDDEDVWSEAKLKKELKEREIKVPAKAKRAQLVDLLREDDNADPF